ncbi:hypothetical protein EDB19DRAFT_1141153 [Suillus lakei]|nr:hypothetical protein EDB19DRAFT_1141153 [Suillus lakei]
MHKHCFSICTLFIIQWLCDCLNMRRRQQVIGGYVEAIRGRGACHLFLSQCRSVSWNTHFSMLSQDDAIEFPITRPQYLHLQASTSKFKLVVKYSSVFRIRERCKRLREQ